MDICYLGLGGNIGDSFAVMEKTVQAIAKLDQVWEVEISRPFLTTPVSSVEQRDYLNAVCRLRTSLTPTELFSKLEEIESAMGKVAKPKEEPRVIDIDMLFYGQKRMESDKLSLPHPRWDQRLFVLAPLADLIDGINMEKLARKFPNETARPLARKFAL